MHPLRSLNQPADLIRQAVTGQRWRLMSVLSQAVGIQASIAPFMRLAQLAMPACGPH